MNGVRLSLGMNLRTIISRSFFFFAFATNLVAGILFCLCCCISRTIYSKTNGCINRGNTSDIPVIDPAVNVELDIAAAMGVDDNGQDSRPQKGVVNVHSQQQDDENCWRRATDSMVCSYKVQKHALTYFNITT